MTLHSHPIPVFGCLDCLRSDAEEFAKLAYSSWKKSYSLPRCPECKKEMAHDGMYKQDGKYCGLVVCMTLDAKEGMAACGDQDISVVLP